MFKVVNKEIKKAMIGGAVALLVSLIGFLGNWLYNKASETSKLTIAIVEQRYNLLEKSSNIPQEIVSNFISYRTDMTESLSDFDTISKIIRKDYFSMDEIRTMQDAIKRCKNTYSYVKQIDEIENKIANRKTSEISNNDLKKYLSMSFEGKREWEKILQDLEQKKTFEKEREMTINLISDSTLALLAKPSIRTGELELQVAIFNSGNSNAMVFTDATISFQGKRVKYSCRGNRSAICLQPFKADDNSYFTLCPCIEKNKDMDDWMQLIRNGKDEEFTITLRDDKGKPIKSETQHLQQL